MTDIAAWGPLIWIEVIGLGGLVGFLIDFILAQGRAPGGVLGTILAGFLGGFLAQWLMGELIPWSLFGVSWLLVIPCAALASLAYLLLMRTLHFY